MGFWENDNEFYPNDPSFGALAGEKVRHHKMPSNHFVMTNHADTANWELVFGVGTYPVNLDAIQVVATLASLPAGYQGYEICYADRTFENSLVLGTDTPLMWTYDDTPTFDDNLVSSTGNYDTRFTILSTGKATPDWLRFHSKDILSRTPSLANTFLRTEFGLKLEKSDYTTEEVYSYLYVIDSEANMMLWDYYNTFATPMTITPRQNYSQFNQPAYLENGVTFDNGIKVLHNEWSEKVFAGSSALATTSPLGNVLVWSSDGNSYEDSPPSNEVNYVTVSYFKDDCYTGFSLQNMVRAGYTKTVNANCEGDCFNGYSTFSCTTKAETYEGIVGDSTARAQYYVPYEGRLNMQLRYEGATLEEKYYPKTPTATSGTRPIFEAMKDWDIGLNCDLLNYDRSYSKLNDYLQTGIYDADIYDIRFNGKLPYRIRRSEALVDNGNKWRIFKPLEYYDMPRTKGAIVNLQAFGDRFIIHTENSLFLTRSKTTLSVDIAQIVLGSGDIFEIAPQEVSPENPSSGTRSKQSCVVTPDGYFFVNDTYGKVYQLANGLTDISLGLRQFFQANLPFLKTIVELEATITVESRYDNDCEPSGLIVPMSQDDYDVYPIIGNVYVINAINYTLEAIVNLEYEYLLLFDSIPQELPFAVTAYRRKEELYWPDNPYLSKGYTIGYDAKYRRLLLTKNEELAELHVTGQVRGIFNPLAPILNSSSFDYFKDGDLYMTEDGYKVMGLNGIATEGEALFYVERCIDCDN
jgi:hypothetical protein